MFFEQIKTQAGASKLLSKEHFSTDGTLLDAAASIKRFKYKKGNDTPGTDRNSVDQTPADLGRNAEVDFHEEHFRNVTHESSTDADAHLYRKAKGKEAKLSFMGHLLTENRNGLIV